MEYSCTYHSSNSAAQLHATHHLLTMNLTNCLLVTTSYIGNHYIHPQSDVQMMNQDEAEMDIHVQEQANQNELVQDEEED